jgi:chromosome partitioning protein
LKKTPIIAFFNNKGGVGKTTLVYHLSWMYADLGARVLATDLDPQANLTAAFLDEDELSTFWPDGPHNKTISGCLDPLQRGTGDIQEPYLHAVTDRLALIVGDLNLSNFEDQLSESWPKCLDHNERAFRVTSAFWRIMQMAATQHNADLVMLDLGPNLGATNRAALIASNYVAVPLSPDLFSLQGLRNLGPRLRSWRSDWEGRLFENPAPDLELPEGQMQPIGYVIQQHSVRLDRPVQAYDRWMEQIPGVYQKAVLGNNSPPPASPSEDPGCLALLKHYRSLVPLAQQARKPMFHLKPADGALGSHFKGAQEAQKDFAQLALSILKAGIAASRDKSVEQLGPLVGSLTVPR